LGEYAIWGKHSLFEESLRSPLIVSYPGIPQPGNPTDSMVETLDLFPTLCDLAKLPPPEFAQGVSLRSILENPAAPGHAAISYFSGSTRSIRIETHRLIVHGDGFVELYDHTSPEKETRNLSKEQPGLVQELLAHLRTRQP
jgi:iduronate 2-sulfatase